MLLYYKNLREPIEQRVFQKAGLVYTLAEKAVILTPRHKKGSVSHGASKKIANPPRRGGGARSAHTDRHAQNEGHATKGGRTDRQTEERCLFKVLKVKRFCLQYLANSSYYVYTEMINNSISVALNVLPFHSCALEVVCEQWVPKR